MTSEHVDIVHRITDAANAGDVETVLGYMHPEIDFIPRRAPVQGSYSGHQGVRDFFADSAESFDVFHTTIEEVRELDDTAVVVSKLTIQGKGSGATVSVPNPVVVRFQDEKIIYFKSFTETADALKAVGLQD